MYALAPGDPGYEEARRATVVNERRPEHRPAVIVRARDHDDVVSAVRLARERGLRLAVRSGGHSWAGSHLREGIVLIDVSELRSVEVDAEAMTARIGPGTNGHELAGELSARRLFFPVGHCRGVCLGGFLLQGGFGWDSRRLGPACMSVTAVEVVTADGETVRADERSHPDLLWAARGSGPGFFGVVTRFELALQPRPGATMTSAYLYPVELLEEVMRWVHEIGPSAPRSMELMVFLRRGLLAGDDPALLVAGPVIAESEEQARADLAVLDTCPVADRALEGSVRCLPTDVGELVAASDGLYPRGWRYAVDNMWTGAAFEDLLPGLRRIAETLPPAPSHMMWMNWGPVPERPDMAFSLEDQFYAALYGVWEHADGDARHASWATERMREMEPLATGIQLADENLARRPAPFVAEANLRRIEEVRARYDPERRFCSWMGPAGEP